MAAVADLVIPVRDEEECIGDVVRAFRASSLRKILVVDTESRDASVARAREAGALVVSEPAPGYGAACLRGVTELRADPPTVVAFADGDGSDEPGDLPALLDPILEGRADLVVGSRALGAAEEGAVPGHAAAGNRVACMAMRLRLGVRYTDLGPFRAIRWTCLERLAMSDRGYGWTIQMQVRAARAGLRIMEVPVRARRRRGGRSKISGSVRGTVGASAKILWLLARYLALPEDVF